MFRPAFIKIISTTIIVAGACTGIVYATGGLAAKQTAGSDTAKRSAAPTDSTGVAVEVARKPIEYYSGGISAELFGLKPPPPPPPAPKLPPAPPVKTPEPDPFSDYVYNGTVSIDSRQMALLENTKTKTGEFIGIGDSFLGGKVASIDERQVVVSLGTTNKTMGKTDDYKLVSLDKNAPFLNGNTAPGATPGAPGTPPPGGPGGPGGMGMGMPGGFGGRMRGMGGGMMFMGGPGGRGPMPAGAAMEFKMAPAAVEAQAAEAAVIKLEGARQIEK